MEFKKICCLMLFTIFLIRSSPAVADLGDFTCVYKTELVDGKYLSEANCKCQDQTFVGDSDIKESEKAAQEHAFSKAMFLAVEHFRGQEKETVMCGEVKAIASPTSAAPVAVKDVKYSEIKVESCKWSNDIPRRIIKGTGPGCTNNESKEACVGYVVCEQNSGGKFMRQSTC